MADGASDEFKKDGGKPRMELVDPTALLDLAWVLTHGAEKYSPNGWREGWRRPDGDDRIVGALLRHVNAIQRGEVYDQEFGLPHAAHAMCNCMFLDWFARQRAYLQAEQPPGLVVGAGTIPLGDVLRCKEDGHLKAIVPEKR